MNVLILFGTGEGQTEKIANYMADVIRKNGHRVTTLLGEHLPADFCLTDFDAAIIGGSIHQGRYQPYISKFVIANRDQLNKLPSAFFTVCMGINSQRAQDREEAASLSKRFLQETGWNPALSETFAGAIRYTQYNFFIRFIMKRIAKSEGGSTDTSRDHEYTDWNAVGRFAGKFVQEKTGASSVQHRTP